MLYHNNVRWQEKKFEFWQCVVILPQTPIVIKTGGFVARSPAE